MNRNLKPSPDESSLPPSALLAGLVALIALFITSQSWILVPAALALVTSRFSRTRLDGAAAPVRLGRYAIFGWILWRAYGRLTSDTGGDSLEMIFAYTVGELCAIEMGLQAWLKVPASGPRSPATILLSAMVFLAASNTFDQRFITFLAPLYFLFMALSWRDFQPVTYSKTLFWKRGAMLAGVLALGVAVHAMVWNYRSEIGLWSMKFLEGKSAQTVGLSTEPRLRSSFNFSSSLTRLLRIEDVPPDQGSLHMRAMAFSHYERNRWLPSIQSRSSQPLRAMQSKGSGPTLSVTRIVDDQQLIFAPLHSTGFHFPDGVAGRFAQPLGPMNSSLEDTGEVLQYEIHLSNEPEFQGLLCQPPDATWRAQYLKIPDELDPRVRELASRIGKGADSDEAKVRAVEQYLIQNHAYSMNALFGRGDPISEFLLKKRSAHCEFFAAASVILLRCLGVPSRYVIGYMAHEADGAGAVVVRGRDAHAWTECWVNGRWVTVDATPGGGRPDERAEPLPLGLKSRESLAKLAASLRAWLEYLRNLPVTFWLVVFGALTIFLVWRIFAARERLAKAEQFHYAPRDEVLERLAARFEKWLRKRQAPCPPGVTWREHLQSFDSPPFNSPRAYHFAKAYDAARFGKAAGAEDGGISELERLLRELESQESKPTT